MPYQTSAAAIQHQSLDSFPNSNMRMWGLVGLLVYEHEQKHIYCLICAIIMLFISSHPPTCWAVLIWHFLTQLISRHKASCKWSNAAIRTFIGPFLISKGQENTNGRRLVQLRAIFQITFKRMDTGGLNIESLVCKYSRKGNLFIAVPLKAFTIKEILKSVWIKF